MWISIETLNLTAALLHGCQAIVAIALTGWLNSKNAKVDNNDNYRNNKPLLFDGGHIGLYRMSTVWHLPNASSTTLPSYESVMVDNGQIDIRGLLIAFFILSAVCQGMASLFRRGRSGAWRYVEYSVSASVMVLAIAAEAGIRDIYTLVCMFHLTWATQLFGIVAEYVHTRETPWLWVLPHLAGWVTCLVAYVPIIDVFLLNANGAGAHPPDFVRAIVFVEFALFICFGFAQGVGLMRKSWAYASDADDPMSAAPLMLRGPNAAWMIYSQDVQEVRHNNNTLEALDDQNEVVFITLSLVAKTLLCWIIFSPLLT